MRTVTCFLSHVNGTLRRVSCESRKGTVWGEKWIKRMGNSVKMLLRCLNVIKLKQ